MTQVWLPYYTCNALLEPFEKARIPYKFYSLTKQLTIVGAPLQLIEGEYLVYINYFGIKDIYIDQLLIQYADELIVDNTQDYFTHGYYGGWSFNSARKSFGVPDGGYLYGPTSNLGTTDEYPVHCDYHSEYLIDRLRGAQSQSYQGFIAYERTLTSTPQRISEFSLSILSQVDYPAVAARRRDNYYRYHAALGHLNMLSLLLELDELSAEIVPFCYPFVPLLCTPIDRLALFAQNIFVPQLWPDVLTRQTDGYAWERQFTQALLPLPVDHRYGPPEVDWVIAAVRALVAAPIDPANHNPS